MKVLMKIKFVVRYTDKSGERLAIPYKTKDDKADQKKKF